MSTETKESGTPVSRRQALKKIGVAAAGAATAGGLLSVASETKAVADPKARPVVQGGTTAKLGQKKWQSDARIPATRRFCEMLDKNPTLRQECLTNPVKARETLEKAGDFEDMPADVKVFVFENEVQSSDEVVTLVLPKKGELPPLDIFDAKSVWLCTWSHYLQ